MTVKPPCICRYYKIKTKGTHNTNPTKRISEKYPLCSSPFFPVGISYQWKKSQQWQRPRPRIAGRKLRRRIFWEGRDLCNKISWRCLSTAVISTQQQEIISEKKSIRWVPRLRLPLPFAAATSVAAASCSLPRVQQRCRRRRLLLLLGRVFCLRQRETPCNEFHHSLFWWQVRVIILVFCFCFCILFLIFWQLLWDLNLEISLKNTWITRFLTLNRLSMNSIGSFTLFNLGYLAILLACLQSLTTYKNYDYHIFVITHACFFWNCILKYMISQF